MTAEIQAGIEKHVEEQVARGGGYFSLPFEEKTLRLKLVRVHTEYLSSLGPRRQFACVDLADVSGDVYDVDFFLDGGAGRHEGDRDDGPQAERPALLRLGAGGGQDLAPRRRSTDATDEHLGVLKGTRRVRVRLQGHAARDPAPARMWLPLPTSDAYQTVERRCPSQRPGEAGR